MNKAPEWSLGFAFTANNSDLVVGLKQITAEAKGVSDEMKKMQKSMGSMPFDKRGFDKAQKAVAKAQEKIAASSVPAQPEIKARRPSTEDTEAGFEGASTARLGAKFYEALEKSKLLADEFTGETAKNFEKVFVEIGKEAFESTKKMGASFDGVSRKTQRAFDNIFEALDKGTLKTLPNFDKIPRLLAGLPGLSVDARKAIVRLGLETKLTSQQVIDLLQSHESAIKKALQGSNKFNKFWESAGDAIGGTLENILPVNKELGKLYDVGEALTEVLVSSADLIKPIFGKAWKDGADFFKKRFGKDTRSDIEKVAQSMQDVNDLSKKLGEADAEKIKEVQFGKDPLEGFQTEVPPVKFIDEDTLTLEAERVEQQAEMLGSTFAEGIERKNKETADKVDSLWKDVNEASFSFDRDAANAARDAAVKAAERTAEEVKNAGDAAGSTAAELSGKPDPAEAAEKAIETAKDQAASSASTAGEAISAKLLEGIKEKLKVGDISGALSQMLDNEIRQGSSRMDELGKDTINRYVDGIKSAIGSADFATQLKEKIENDLKQSEEALQSLGRSAGEKFTSTIKDSLGKADFSSEVKGLADKVSISSIIPDTNALNEALNGFGANFNRLKDTVTMATDSITGDVGQGMRLLVTGAFRDMSESKDAFVKNLTDATTKISESMAKMKEAIVPEPQIERLNEIERGLDATEAKLKSLMEQEPPSSGQVPEELRGEMSQEVGDIKESISASSGEGMLEKLKGIIQSGQASADLGPAIAAMQRMPSEVASRVASAVGGAVSKIPSASTESNMSVNVPEVAKGFGNIAKNVAGRFRGR